MPGFVELWPRMLGRRAREPGAAAATWTRTTSGSAPAAGSRPRTKDRPSHEDADDGVVVDGRPRPVHRAGSDGHEVTAMKARELGRRSVVVGDRVALVGDVSGTTDTLARIVRVEPRTSTLRRTADDTDPFERVIVANADQLVIVTALADPEPRPRMIDRCLVAAFDAGLRPAAVPDQVRPGAGRTTLLEAYGAARRRPRRDPAARSRWTSCGRTCAAGSASWSATPGVGQVDAGQRAGARRRPGDRRRQRRDRPRPAHLVVGDRPRAARTAAG